MEKTNEVARPPQHVWKFFRAGGFCQVRLDGGEDLTALDQLDQKLWVALSCPVQGLELEAETLELIDKDKDGRIRVPEILEAVKWACSMVKDPAVLLQGSPSLDLSTINDDCPEGLQVRNSARRILDNLGKGDVRRIGVEDTTSTERIFAQTLFNGDGIITPQAAEGQVQAVIGEIMACLGSEIDRSGKAGIGQAKADQLFVELRQFSDWWTVAERDTSVLPLGKDTLAAAEALKATRAKVEDYFARCRLAAFDARALTALNRQESEYLAIAAKDLTITAAEVAGFPLARVEAGKPLPLVNGVNPAWAEAIGRLKNQVIKPLLGDKDSITEAEWAEICAKFASLAGWMAAKPVTAVEKLGLPRVREILSGPYQEAISALIAKDKALEGEANAIAAVDKLVRLNRDLYRLLNNFVSFRDFYSRRQLAAFQAGTLYLDQRACDLCIRVLDAGKHAAIAHLSGMYLAYCDLVRTATGERMMIVAAFTAGDSDNLMVGRNGVFYDRQGRDWDATIVRIVDNPISLRQAFWAPYKRAVRWVEDQLAKRAAADADVSNQMTSAAAVTQGPPAGKPAESKPRFDVGVVAALGVAVGGITAALGMVLQAFFNLGYRMPLGLVAIILLISGPSMLVAYLKLRHRNLGPLLDATGWAINSKAMINIPFGRSLTTTAKLPLGAMADLVDPYAVEHHWKPKVALASALFVPLLVCALWFFGAVETILPGVLPQSWWVRHRAVAAAPAVPAAAVQAIQPVTAGKVPAAPMPTVVPAATPASAGAPANGAAPTPTAAPVTPAAAQTVQPAAPAK